MLMLYAYYNSHSFLNAFSPYPMKIYKIKQVLSALHEASCRQIFWKKLLTTTNLAQTLPTMCDVMRPNGLVALGLPTRTAINRLVLAAAPVGLHTPFLLWRIFPKGCQKILCIQKSKQTTADRIPLIALPRV